MKRQDAQESEAKKEILEKRKKAADSAAKLMVQLQTMNHAAVTSCIKTTMAKCSTLSYSAPPTTAANSQ